MTHRQVVVAAGGIGLAALWPLSAAFNWFGVNIGTLEQMTRTDPEGIRVLPAILLFVRPLLAGAAALLAPLAAVRVASAPPPEAPRILARAAVVQLALTTVFALAAGPVATALARLLPMFPDRRTPGAYVSPGHFLALQDAADTALTPALLALAAACGVLAAAARRASARVAR